MNLSMAITAKSVSDPLRVNTLKEALNKLKTLVKVYSLYRLYFQMSSNNRYFLHQGQ